MRCYTGLSIMPSDEACECSKVLYRPGENTFPYCHSAMPMEKSTIRFCTKGHQRLGQGLYMNLRPIDSCSSTVG